MTPHAFLFTLAAIGISETMYLIRTRRAHEKPVCVIGGNTCHLVLGSKYNKLLGVHNDLFGFFFYIVIAFIASFIVIGIEPYATWLTIAKIAISVATVVSFIFIYLQWRVIRAWCFWCLMATGTVFLMDIIVLVANLSLPT